LAADLVKRQVDLTFAVGAIAAAAAKGATSTIPVVFLSADDPVRRGFVAGLARPGGNLTGVSHLDIGMTPKLIELAAELPPNSSGIASLVNPQSGLFMEAITELARQAAQNKGVPLHVRGPAATAYRAGTGELRGSPQHSLVPSTESILTPELC